VVASEIRKLSDQTKKAVDNISGLIHNSLAQVAKVTDGMQSIDDRMKSVHRGVLGVLDNFQDIRQSMADMKEASELIAKELEDSLQNIHDIGAAAGKVAKSAAELSNRSQKLITVE
jgi:heme-based aerotactic transducer